MSTHVLLRSIRGGGMINQFAPPEDEDEAPLQRWVTCGLPQLSVCYLLLLLPVTSASSTFSSRLISPPVQNCDKKKSKRYSNKQKRKNNQCPNPTSGTKTAPKRGVSPLIRGPYKEGRGKAAAAAAKRRCSCYLLLGLAPKSAACALWLLLSLLSLPQRRFYPSC